MCPPLCFTMPYTVARPSPVPLPGSLVVKNGSKMLGTDRRRPCRAGVAHREHDVAARAAVRRGARVGLVAGRRRRLDGERAAVGHRVAGVDRQVHHHLLDLPGSARTGTSSGVERRDQRRRPRRSARRSSRSMSATIAFRSSDRAAASTCWRLKARSCRVSGRGALARPCGSRSRSSRARVVAAAGRASTRLGCSR